MCLLCDEDEGHNDPKNYDEHGTYLGWNSRPVDEPVEDDEPHG